VLRWFGALSTRTAVLVLVAAALLGVVFTLLAGKDPGFTLGFFVVIGSIVATLGVRRGAIYLFFPLPALSLFLGAIMIGAVHDRAVEATGSAGLRVAFLQWVAAAFFPMCIATAVALAIGGGRWVLGRQLVTGNFPAPPPAGRPIPPGPANTRQAPGARRPSASDPWADDAPRSARQAPGAPVQNGPAQNGTGPRPAGAPWRDDPRAPRDQRDQRASRDPWGDPRLPSPPPPPPAADPRTRPSPQFQPRDRTAPRPAQGDPWDPSTRPARPPRDPRDQR
jgi:hypothetical protein